MGVTLVGLLFIIRAVLVAIGICMIPAGAVFLFPSGVIVRYALIGKIMAYTSAVTMCARPVGQMESF